MTDILLGGALANTSGKASSEDLLQFLKTRTDGVDYYRLVPPPGSTVAAAFDWQAVLGVTASALAIGQALWAAYQKFVKPLRDSGSSDAFLFVAVKNERKEFIQFALGKDHDSEESFVREFSEKVEQIRISSNAGDVEIEKQELLHSETWKKI